MHNVKMGNGALHADTTYMFLKHMKNLESLDLSGNAISSAGMRRMIDQLCQSSAPPKLRFLNLAGNEFHSADLKMCLTRVKVSGALKELRQLTADMNQCGLTVSRGLFPKVKFLQGPLREGDKARSDEMDFASDDV
mmetsp:Transcript_19144/g.28747  ORF Transcript_19144/g.28747 Transcript_19144/m.28747 type:complete len:136 (-) Transcript_19144:15-422(-)